mmetsp:Transcript_16671/g.18369  ORF Transcript_16671/g.18369 Transcript_16671/m.18369 type:complete len:95 (+) Transcript_16671:256-540(+)
MADVVPLTFAFIFISTEAILLLINQQPLLLVLLPQNQIHDLSSTSLFIIIIIIPIVTSCLFCSCLEQVEHLSVTDNPPQVIDGTHDESSQVCHK